MAFSSFGWGRKVRLKGGVDAVSRGVVVGWVVNRDSADKPCEVEVLAGGKSVARVLADLPRPDLAGKGEDVPSCGYRIPLFDVFAHRAGEIELRDVASGHVLPGGVLACTDGLVTGCFDGIVDGACVGWASPCLPGADPVGIDLLIDDRVCASEIAHLPRPDLIKLGLVDSQVGFSIDLPAICYDGDEHEVAIRARSGESALRGVTRKFQAKFRGHLDVVRPDRVSGWLVNTADVTQAIPLELRANGQVIAAAMAASERSDLIRVVGTTRAGFDFSVPASAAGASGGLTIGLYVAGTDVLPFGICWEFSTDLDLIAALESSASALLASCERSDSLASPDPNGFARRSVIPNLIWQIRQNFGKSPTLNFTLPEVKYVHVAARSMETTVDVIIPVYKGVDETMACIDSVLRARSDTPYELVVINDRSPQWALTSELRKRATREAFTLLENDENLGFVKTVNRGMRLHLERDVVLLNSDTVVPDGWLDRMRAAAYSSRQIGTVTALSNRATICSLPIPQADNDMPAGLTVQDMDDICAGANPGVVVDIPTAIGFCMYIKRDTLNEVGYFDEERWGKGYAEENDFCLRANTIGWRHVAACDVFVQHHGAVSFDAESKPRVKANLEILNKLYPDYPKRIQRFIAADPIGPARRKAVIEMLRRSKCSYWLFVVHGWGGGTETAAQNLARLLAAEDVKVFTLRSPVGKGKLRLELPADAIVMEYPADEIGGGLIDDLRAIGVKHVHYHHTIGFDKSVWDIPKLLGINYDVAIHDFYFGCPRVNLIDDSGHFCGQPALEVCERCVEYSGLPEGVEEQFESLGGTVEAWRTFHLERLRRARKVIAPSHDALSRTLQYLPIENGVALPHPEPLARIALTPPPVAGAPLRVAVIGAIGKHKGHDLLVACARHAHRHELPIHFVVVGYTCNDKAYEGLPNLTITGAYEAERLPELLRASHCAVALFMSVWPETFSYTLSEAYRAGLWPVVFDLGAPAERVRATDIGTVIPATKEPAEICKVVTSIGRASIHGARAIEVGSEYASIVEDYYDLTSTKIRTFAMVERATVA